MSKRRHEALLVMVKDALREQEDFWYSLPSGVDMDADPMNGSPEDMVDQVAGLATKSITELLEEL